MKSEEKFIEDLVLEIVGDHMGIPTPTLSTSNHIISDLGADSLDRMELIMTVEELFGIKIPDDDIVKIERISDIIMSIVSTNLSSSHLQRVKKEWKMVSVRKS